MLKYKLNKISSQILKINTVLLSIFDA